MGRSERERILASILLIQHIPHTSYCNSHLVITTSFTKWRPPWSLLIGESNALPTLQRATILDSFPPTRNSIYFMWTILSFYHFKQLLPTLGIISLHLIEFFSLFFFSLLFSPIFHLLSSYHTFLNQSQSIKRTP